MKNLKTYKLFESTDIPQDIIDEIMDIGKDLTDDGFYIRFLDGDILYPSIIITMPLGDKYLEFRFVQIEEFINTTKSYLNSEGYDYQVCIKGYTGILHDLESFRLEIQNKVKSTMFKINIISRK